MNHEDRSDIEHVRHRPSMYIATTNFFGLIHYFVSAVGLFLDRQPSWIAIEILEDRFRIRSNVNLGVERTTSGELLPFEKVSVATRGLGVNGLILTALSSQLTVSTEFNGSVLQITYDRGQRIKESVSAGDISESTVEFSPDRSIFTATEFSPYNFHSYFHRISFLNPTVSFSLTDRNGTRIYHSPTGIRGMFDAVASPYQILHEPVHIRHVEGDLDLEVVWGFYSWEGDVVWSFINKGRAVRGGTHDRGLADAFRSLPKKIGISHSDHDSRNGIVAIMSINYPKVVWEGCVKDRVANKELRPLVRKTIVEQSLNWINSHDRVRDQMQKLQKFHFPSLWTSSG